MWRVDLAWLTPLVFTLAGGTITYATQAGNDRRTAGRQERAEEREAARSRDERQRDALLALLDKVVADLAASRREALAVQEASRALWEERLARLAGEIRLSHDGAIALIARVEAKGVRDAANAAYTVWGKWCSDGGSALDEVDRGEDPRFALDEFAAAVRAQLDLLTDSAAPRSGHPTPVVA